MDMPYIGAQAKVMAALQGKEELPPDIATFYSLFYYTKSGITKDLLHKIKYYSKADVAVKLGNLLGKQYQDSIPKEAILVPVPLHPKRFHQRGFNQAEKIARGMAEVTQNEIMPTALKRVIHEDSQTKKSKAERKEILSRTFQLDQLSEDARKIILVDDIITTGSTAQACVNVLKKARPESISIATLGIAV